MTALIVVYFLWPPGRTVTVVAVAAGAAGAIAVGLRLYHPRRTVPWLLLAAALLVNTAARVLSNVLPDEPLRSSSWDWTILALHVVVASLLTAGVVGLTGVTFRTLPGAIDAVIIGLGAAMVATLLIAIHYALPPVAGLSGHIEFPYAARDALILAAALLLASAARRSTSVLLVFVGLMSLLTYALVLRIGRLYGAVLAGTPVDLAWLAFYAAVGAAALVPSMAATRGPLTAGGPEVTPIRLVPVAVAVLLPTALLVAELLSLPRWTQPLVVTVVAVVLVLVFARLADLAVRLRRQVDGERVLRKVIGELADAQDAAAVRTTLARATSQLGAPGVDYRAAFTAAGVPLSIEATADGAHPIAPPTPWGSTVDSVDRHAATTIGPRLEVLATEAALALERIRLQGQVIRHTSEEYFRTLVQNSTDVILIVDDQGRIRYASPSATEVLGNSSAEGVALATLVRTEDRPAVAQLLGRARTATTSTRTSSVELSSDWTVPRAGRGPARVEASCLDLRHDPFVGGLVVTLRDVTEQRHLQHELHETAFQDPLTGLGNRLAFSDELERAVATSSGSRTVATIFVDMDDLNVINDGLGHEIGDALLTRVGERLRDFVGESLDPRSATVARLGGDEFAVVLDGVRNEYAAEEAGKDLVATLSRPMRLNGHDVTCTASVGVATTTRDVGSSAELLRHADLALYAAKAAGKGRSYRYQPWMRDAVMDRLELRSALERAIVDEALFLEYQPIVALDTGRPVGFEALLRWLHPVRGRLAPDQFITVAEDSGLIGPIGAWVLDTAARAITDIAPAGSDDAPYVAVNVSARQLQNPDFVPTVRRVVAGSGLAPQRLLLEITESVLLRDGESTWHELERLRQSSVRVAIDDFGTGYSALSYLRQVPLDIVKLDRLFIQQMTTSSRQRQLVEGIVSLTKILGLQVVAEGIETELELSLAQQAGCTFGQGFLFSKPMPATAAREWLAVRR
jgi:diguanylate cyclase (GGDEF)-like protein/PAS domain S-box-containing protein